MKTEIEIIQKISELIKQFNRISKDELNIENTTDILDSHAALLSASMSLKTLKWVLSKETT